MPKTHIKCENLYLGYDSTIIVEGLSFSVEEGDYLCIVGENGAGKTTLMKNLLGLKDPVEGSIILGDNLKKSEIGYLPQQTAVQRDFPASVMEIVLTGCQSGMGLFPFYRKKEKKRAEDNLRRLGMAEYKNACYRELSGGQQQRVLLARALCSTEKVLLLDEPVAGLDPGVTASMYEIIQNLNNEGITIIMITHDVAAAVKYAGKILHIGDENFFGTTEEYLLSKAGRKFLAGEE